MCRACGAMLRCAGVCALFGSELRVKMHVCKVHVSLARIFGGYFDSALHQLDAA